MGALLSETAYFRALRAAMRLLAAESNVVFMGQGVAAGGTTMIDTLSDVSLDKRLEFPVAEDLQMGTAIGMALGGMLPVCVYPRWNFLLLAANQMVNHLDRLPLYSGGGYAPKVIIRVAVPVTEPFYPGPQHDDDFTAAFRMMLRTVQVMTLECADDVVPAYAAALRRHGSTLLVEYTGLYNSVPVNVSQKQEVAA